MTERPFKLGLLVLAHGLPEQLAELLSLLQDPRIVVYLHVDRRVPVAPFRAALERARVRVRNVVWLRRRPTPWGYINIIDVELDGLTRAAADGCGYVMLISGQDVPLRPASDLVEFAAQNRTCSYVSAVPAADTVWPYGGRMRTDFYSYRLCDRMYTCVPRGEDLSAINPVGMNARGAALNWALRAWSSFKPERRFPDYLEPYGGQHWMNLSADAVRYVLGFVAEHPDYRRYHQYTTCADEIFLQSIVVGSDFARDNDVVNDDLRFQLWSPKAHHPTTLTLADLPSILASDDLFARKVDRRLDPELFVRLTELVRFS